MFAFAKIIIIIIKVSKYNGDGVIEI